MDSNMYLVTIAEFEILLDYISVSVSAQFVTPVFTTSAQITYAVLTFICSLVLLFFSIYDLYDSEVSIHSRL